MKKLQLRKEVVERLNDDRKEQIQGGKATTTCFEGMLHSAPSECPTMCSEICGKPPQPASEICVSSKCYSFYYSCGRV